MYMAYKTSFFCTCICVCTSFLVPYMMHPCTDSCDISFVLCMWNDLYAYQRQIRWVLLYLACIQMFVYTSFWSIDFHAKQHGTVCEHYKTCQSVKSNASSASQNEISELSFGYCLFDYGLHTNVCVHIFLVHRFPCKTAWYSLWTLQPWQSVKSNASSASQNETSELSFGYCLFNYIVDINIQRRAINNLFGMK